jgi:hypothetical protein
MSNAGNGPLLAIKLNRAVATITQSDEDQVGHGNEFAAHFK